MNDKMYEKLLELSSSRKLVSIFTDTDNTENFNVGFIPAINEDDIIIQHIDPDGLYDGYILKKTKNIYHIEYDSRYLEKINKLYNAQVKKHNKIILTGHNLVVSHLKLAKQNNYVVSVELSNSGVLDVQGFVSELNEECISINLITEFGEDDGTANIDIKSITRIDCDSDKEQSLKLLKTM